MRNWFNPFNSGNYASAATRSPFATGPMPAYPDPPNHPQWENGDDPWQQPVHDPWQQSNVGQMPPGPPPNPQGVPAPPPPQAAPGFGDAPARAADFAQLAQVLVNSSLATQAAVQDVSKLIAFGHQQQANQQGFRQLKPKREVAAITAADAATLMDELTQFQIDLSELGVNDRGEAAFFQLRAVAHGQAKDVIEYELAQARTRELHVIGLQLPAGAITTPLGTAGLGRQRHELFAKLFNQIVDALHRAVNLTQDKKAQIAMQRNAESKMRGDTCDDAIAFLREYRKGRLSMIRADLLPDYDAMLGNPQILSLEPSLQAQLRSLSMVAEQRDVLDLLERRLAKPVFEYIKQLPMQPTTVTEVLGLVQQWAESKRRGEKPGGRINATLQDASQNWGPPCLRSELGGPFCLFLGTNYLIHCRYQPCCIFGCVCCRWERKARAS